MLIGILAALSMIAIAKAIYWKLCFQGVLLYIPYASLSELFGGGLLAEDGSRHKRGDRR